MSICGIGGSDALLSFCLLQVLLLTAITTHKPTSRGIDKQSIPHQRVVAHSVHRMCSDGTVPNNQHEGMTLENKI